MNKRYEIKVSEITTPSVPKKTFSFVSGNKEAISLKTDIRFDGSQNGGQGAMRLVFNKPFNSDEFELGNLIRIIAYDEENLLGQGVYYGYVNNLKRLSDPEGESIEITTYGLSALMNTVSAGSPTGSLGFVNTDPSVIITFLLNQFNAQYPFPLISFDPIPLFGTPITFIANQKTILTVMQDLHNITGRIFYVDGSGKFSTQPKGTVPDHIFTLKYNLNTLEKNTDRSDIVNKIIVQVTNNVLQRQIDPSSGLLVQVVVQFAAFFTYENPPSQAINGVLSRFLDKSEIQINEGVESAALLQFKDDYLAEHANPKNFLRLKINDKADYLNVKPGDLVRVKNIDFSIDDALVNKINYSSSGLSIDCEKTISFAQEVVKS